MRVMYIVQLLWQDNLQLKARVPFADRRVDFRGSLLCTHELTVDLPCPQQWRCVRRNGTI